MYVADLNKYSHVKIGKVGDYIWNKFPMEAFLERVYSICVYTEETNIDRICDTLMDMMVNQAQPDFFDDMARDLQ